jgi:hypothetical protein
MTDQYGQGNEVIDAILADFDRAPEEAMHNLETFGRMMREAGYFGEARLTLEVVLCVQAVARGTDHPETLRTRHELDSLGLARRELYDDMVRLGAAFSSSERLTFARGAADMALALGLLEQAAGGPEPEEARALLARLRAAP